MARPVVLSNGEMHVGLNEYGQVHDFYFPYVGQENHLASKDASHKIGIWVDGVFSWTDDGSWDCSVGYHTDTLIGKTTLTHSTLNVRLEFDDFIDHTQSVFVRNCEIVNLANHTREIRVFFHQVFIISNSRDSDTAQYLPHENALLHYKGHRSFIISAAHANGSYFDDYSVGLFGIEGHEGTFRDAEDGALSKNSVEHGMVDSVLGLSFTLDAHDSSRAHYWIAGGKSQREALWIHNKISEEGALHYLTRTATYWQSWLSPVEHFLQVVDETYRPLVVRSLLTVKAHQDKRGAVIASTDTTMLNYARDAYAYCWPRDGAYAMWPLVRLGFKDEPLHFFGFCRRVLHDGGYLQHKYLADGSLGSSWHSYLHLGTEAPPIQTDETAAVLFVFQQYYVLHKDEKLLRDFYPTMVAPMANFLAGYVDEHGLPKPSYDLWEEKFLTTTYTAAITYASLLAASSLADDLSLTDDALRWQTAAERIKQAAHMFYDQDGGALIKGFGHDANHLRYEDTTLDMSSLYGAYMFGLFEHASPEISSTIDAVLSKLSQDEESGYPRYEHDRYNAISETPNPWPICSLWMAQYYTGQGQHDRAKELVEYVQEKALASGILAEQFSPTDHTPLSVAPLTWSHAEFISTIIDIYSSEAHDE